MSVCVNCVNTRDEKKKYIPSGSLQRMIGVREGKSTEGMVSSSSQSTSLAGRALVCLSLFTQSHTCIIGTTSITFPAKDRLMINALPRRLPDITLHTHTHKWTKNPFRHFVIFFFFCSLWRLSVPSLTLLQPNEFDTHTLYNIYCTYKHV